MNNLLNEVWPIPREKTVSGSFTAPATVSFTNRECPERFIKDFKRHDLEITDEADLNISLEIDRQIRKPESYILNISPSGGRIIAADEPGLSYGLETLAQTVALHRGSSWPEMTINDHPAYGKRCFMLDMGRSVFTMPMLKRTIRILARLKMNQLHLHLYDDELCGVRFNGLPFGSGNPYAISIADLAEIVRYAAGYHVEIVPELEAWGHVGSLVYHRPELCGGEGMYNGSSFRVGEYSFALIRSLIEQVAGVMPRRAIIHLGLDEAKWFTDNSVPPGYSPDDMIIRYYNMLKDIGDANGQSLTMRIWADHAGRPIPESIRGDIILEPWQYWRKNADDIELKVEQYSAMPDVRWMAAGGISSAHYRGAYHATRHWTEKAADSQNVEGVNITFWCWNDLDRKMISLFAGSQFIWNPRPDNELAQIKESEEFDQLVFPVMHQWGNMFDDADPELLEKERGPAVFNGYYFQGPNRGRPVAPTAPAANTRHGHDFINE